MANEISCQCGKAFRLVFRRAIFDGDVVALDIATFLQRLAEGSQAHNVDLGGPDAEKADHRHRQLLRAQRQRPRNRRSTNKRNELTPSHSCPSSKMTRPD